MKSDFPKVGRGLGKKKKVAEPVAPEYPKVIEQFNKPSNIYERNTPGAFNGMVEVVKYKITIEIVQEEKEVYRQRLQKLWEECDNYHSYHPLESEARRLGVTLEGNFGAKKVKRGY